MPTTATYRLAAGEALNDIKRLAVGAGPTTTSIPLGFLATSNANVSANMYDDAYLYVQSGAGAGQQTIVKKGSYVPSTGVVVVASAVASVVVGDYVDLTRIFPCRPAPISSDSDYLTLLNKALKRINVRRELLIPIITGRRLPLSGYPWLDSQDRIVSVWEPSPRGTGLVDSGWRQPKLVNAGFLCYLELRAGFAAAGGYVRLEVIAPGDTFIRVASVEGESSVGLVSEGDEAIPPVDEMTTAFLVEAYEVLMHRSPANPNGDWRNLHAMQEAKAKAEVDLYDFGRVKPAPAQPEQQAAPGGRAA